MGWKEMGNRFDVNIAGYTLSVTTERTADHMERLCGLLNERVRDVQKSGVTANYLHVVMLAAMRLADEVLRLQGEMDDEKKRVERKSRDLIQALDSALK
jgi:cell division protein ZapA (FtsZ GTPase activity inhibitor)